MTAIFLCMCLAKERRRYIVTLSLIGWAHVHKMIPEMRPQSYQQPWKRQYFLTTGVTIKRDECWHRLIISISINSVWCVNGHIKQAPRVFIDRNWLRGLLPDNIYVTLSLIVRDTFTNAAGHGRQPKITSWYGTVFRITGPCEGNSPVTGPVMPLT